MSHPTNRRQRKAGLALVAVAALGVCTMGAWPRLMAATPGAVWIDFGVNDVVLRSQLVRTAQGPFLGMAEVQANGTGRVAQVTQRLSIPDTPAEDGLFHATGSHVFLFADGSSFSTADDILLAPTGEEGVYDLDGSLVITGGTGTFATAGGDLSLIGNIDLIHGKVGVDTRGRIQK